MPDQDEATPVTPIQEHAPPRRKRGPKPGTTGAKAGGNAVKAKYGSEYFAAIGKRGGARMRELYGSEHYERIGRKGGLSTRERLGLEHYRRAGHKGGTAKRKNQLDQ